jgi:hypothetical protein
MKVDGALELELAGERVLLLPQKACTGRASAC